MHGNKSFITPRFSFNDQTKQGSRSSFYSQKPAFMVIVSAIPTRFFYDQSINSPEIIYLIGRVIDKGFLDKTRYDIDMYKL
jgi:hypothetical protein